MFQNANEWENFYLQTPPKNLPWDAGGPDPVLVSKVESGEIPVCQALDLGTGSGHDALYLIQKGFDVVGIDWSSTAIQLTRERVSHAGFFAFFQVADVRSLPMEDGYVEFVNDRGCWHSLSMPDREKALNEIHRVLKKRGLFLLRVFKAPCTMEDGPHAFSREELECVLKEKFKIRQWHEDLFLSQSSHPSYVVLLEKK